jgi:hypothetical protein
LLRWLFSNTMNSQQLIPASWPKFRLIASTLISAIDIVTPYHIITRLMAYLNSDELHIYQSFEYVQLTACWSGTDQPRHCLESSGSNFTNNTNFHVAGRLRARRVQSIMFTKQIPGILEVKLAVSWGRRKSLEPRPPSTLARTSSTSFPF